RADAYLLGHIHKGQAWKIGDAPCIYPGSPRRTAFGETERKGYTVVELDKHGVIGCEFVEVPATPMVHIEGAFDETLRWYEQGPDVKGAEVRLRYQTPADQRDAARAAVEVARR